MFVTLLALAFLQVWGAKNPFHKDAWFESWRHFVAKRFISGSGDGAKSSEISSFITLAIPLLSTLILFAVLENKSAWLMLPVAVIVLLYSFGRGEFFEIVREYTQACYVEDWESASNRARRFHVDVDSVEAEDWPTLHRHVFDEAAYRGFERLFAVLFWFFVLGPIGALMYRLVFIAAKNEEPLASRWLWLLEWPAVRILGLSFALTGNFAGCVEHLKECATCFKRSTIEALSPVILGALSVSDEMQPDCEITRKELTLMSKLYQRTLWFWMSVVSLIVIFT